MNQQYVNLLKRKRTNGPTAAVIRYDNEEAPKVVASGSGAVARKIMDLAKQHDVQIQEDDQLVGHLLDIDLGDSVPPQLYAVIAEILLLIEKMEQDY